MSVIFTAFSLAWVIGDFERNSDNLEYQRTELSGQGRLTCLTQYPQDSCRASLWSRSLSFVCFPLTNLIKYLIYFCLRLGTLPNNLFITFHSLPIASSRLPRLSILMIWWNWRIFPVSLPIPIPDVSPKPSITYQFMFWSLIGSFKPMSKHWSTTIFTADWVWKQTTNQPLGEQTRICYMLAHSDFYYGVR